MAGVGPTSPDSLTHSFHLSSTKFTITPLLQCYSVKFSENESEGAGIGTLREGAGIGTLRERAGIGTLREGAGIGTLREGAGVGTLREGAGIGTLREGGRYWYTEGGG